jgi:hypothetical protein
MGGTEGHSPGLSRRAWYRRYPPVKPFPAFLIPALLLLPYLVHELDLGKVQLLVVEIVCFALLLLDQHRIGGGLLLGLAAAVKVWPAFLLRYLLLRRHWRFTLRGRRQH